MVRRRSPDRIRILFRLALGGYLANCALGTAVQTRLVDTSGSRWVHHVLYVVTSVLTGAAIGIGALRRAPQAAILAPVVVPLALLPRVGHRRHLPVALTAAPFYAGAALLPIDPR